MPSKWVWIQMIPRLDNEKVLFWRGDKNNNIGGTWFYAPFWLEREEGTNDGQTHSCALQSMHCLVLCSWSTCLLWINNTDFFQDFSLPCHLFTDHRNWNIVCLAKYSKCNFLLLQIYCHFIISTIKSEAGHNKSILNYLHFDEQIWILKS